MKTAWKNPKEIKKIKSLSIESRCIVTAHPLFIRDISISIYTCCSHFS